MFTFRQWSSSAQAALGYITAGSLIIVWSAVWYLFLRSSPPESGGVFYLCLGSFLTGVVLLLIGLAVGQIGRSARRADSPVRAVPNGVTPTPTVPVAAQPSVTPVPDGRVVVPLERHVVSNT